tara:strand:+ start:11 stop:391 length:381 start_codon:yes stop_codon:yes gene_type:complete
VLVNISYSIDFEEVPKVVRSFLQEDIRKNLEAGIVHGLEDSIASLECGEENIGKAIKHIDEIRDLLVKLDVRLLDCSSILRGYQKELISPAQVGQPSQHEDLSSLQENISKLREELGGGNNETESG